METTTKVPPSQDKDFWKDVRQSVRGGLREIQNVGDEIARQGRLHVDIFNTERRLKSAYHSLGETVHRLLSDRMIIAADDPAVIELSSRISYYRDELDRLQTELKNPQTPQN